MSGLLVIVRHGESEWNATGRWTGITDVHLTRKGIHEGELLGEKLTHINFNHAFVSEQIRTTETLKSLLKTQGQITLTHDRRWALNERDYGEYTGLNKWQVKEKLGEAQFNCIRRNWDCPVPGGETLRDVYQRVIPFYLKEVVPRLHNEENILLVSHGNAIRALMKYIETISDEAIAHVEMIFGTILIYHVDREGRMKDKKKLSISTELPPA